MNKFLDSIIFGLGFCFLLEGCAALTTEKRDWDFVQSIGGISVNPPLQTPEGWSLPINCDVSGLRRVTVKPSTLNSALVCSNVTVSQTGNRIFITVQTALVRQDKTTTSSCGAVPLGNLKPGEYEILYQNNDGTTHPIGNIEIKR